MATTLDIEAAIKTRQAEIIELRVLRRSVKLLVADADRVAWGKPSRYTPMDFQIRLDAAQKLANKLGLYINPGALDLLVVK